MESGMMSWLALCVVLRLSYAASVRSKHCQCVSDQWQAILASTDREFDLTGGRTAALGNRLYVSYDYKNRRFAMTDLNSGNRAIANYGQGYKFVVRGDGCHRIRTTEQMKQMCLPADSKFGGEFKLGDDLMIDMWEFSTRYNMTMKTTVLQKDCIPVTEEVFMKQGRFASLTSSMYLDVSLGIQDADAFSVPAACDFDEVDNILPQLPPQEKRGGGGLAWGLSQMLEDQDLQLH